jgi:hypothetical protein
MAAAAHWTVTTPKGWAFLFSTLVAVGVGSCAADRWSAQVGFFVFLGALVVARVIVPGPPDLGEAAALTDLAGAHEGDHE